MIGDGWIQANEKSLFLAGDPIEDKEYYDVHMGKLVSKIITPVKIKDFSYWRVYGISIHKKETIKKILLNFDLPKGKKVKTAKIPSWIKNSKKEIKISFLRGLFDTDGCVFCQKDYTKYANEFNSKYHSKIRLRFTTISSKLNKEIFSLMKGLEY